MAPPPNKVYLDSNVLIYFQENDSPFNKKATHLITTAVSQEFSLFITPLTIDETIHGVLQDLKIKKVKNPFSDTIKALKNILKLPGLEIINPPSDVANQMKILNYMEKFSLRARDAYHLLTMKANKIMYLATFDNDFQKVFEAKALKKFE